MKKEILIVITIIGGLVLFGIGYSLGLSSGKAIPEKKVAEGPTSVLEKSKVIQSQWAYAEGEVSEIKDRTITLTVGGDTLSIPIAEGIRIIRTVTGEEEEKIEFKDVKFGDKLLIQLAILEGGRLEGRDVIVFPAAAE